jgi:hypothetical protein
MIFYDFVCNLQETAKWFYYLSYQFAGRPSERSFALQCGPWGARPARVEQIPASSSPAWPGKGGEGCMDYWGSVCGLDWGEERPVGRAHRDRRRWPPRLPNATGVRPGRATGGRGGFWGASGGGEGATLACGRPATGARSDGP